MSTSTIYITTSTHEEAAKIARTLVGERLAACANIIGEISSIYFWQGKVREEPETALILKTRSELVAPLTARIKELHSYDCPCVTALEISDGNLDYIDWITEETSR